MSSARQSLGTIGTGSEVISKISSDAVLGQACAANKAVYRINTTAGNGVTVFPNVFPLKPPCCVFVRILWTYAGSSGAFPIVVLQQLMQINQTVVGAAILPVAISTLISQSVPGNTLGLTLTPATNFVNVTLTNTSAAADGPYQNMVEIEVFYNKLL